MVAVVIISQGIGKELCKYLENVLENKTNVYMTNIDYDYDTTDNEFYFAYGEITSILRAQYDQVLVFLDKCNGFVHFIRNSALKDHGIIFIPMISLPVLIDIVGMTSHAERLSQSEILLCIQRYNYSDSSLAEEVVYDGKIFNVWKENKNRILREEGLKMGTDFTEAEKLIEVGKKGVENITMEARKFFVDHYDLSDLEKKVVTIPLKNGADNPIINGIERYNRISYIAAVNNLISSKTVKVEYVDQRTVLEEQEEDKTRFYTIKEDNVIGTLQAIDSKNLYIIPNERFKSIVPSDAIPYLKAYMRFIKDGDMIEVITWDILDSRIGDGPRDKDF